MANRQANQKNLLYGYVDFCDGEPPKVLITNLNDASDIVAALEAAGNSNTWGEYRKNCPKVFLDRDNEHQLEYEDELPTDDAPFSFPFSSIDDYEWPKFTDGLSGQGIPERIISEYGNPLNTVLDGTFIYFNSEQIEEIIQKVEDLGYTIERDDRTVRNAAGFGELRLG